MIPIWPDRSVNYRSVTGGVECTMKTHYRGIDIGVHEIGETIKDAETAARNSLTKKIRQYGS